MTAYTARPGTDYNIYVVPQNGYCVRRRLGGRTWEYLSNGKGNKGDMKWFVSFKQHNAQQPMQLRLNGNDDVWLVRTRFMTSKHYKMQLVEQGTLAELWPLFLTYQNMMRSR